MCVENYFISVARNKDYSNKKLKMDTIPTKVNIQESCVSPLNQNLLAWSSKSFMHEVHTVCDQWPQPLCITLEKEDKHKVV